MGGLLRDRVLLDGAGFCTECVKDLAAFRGSDVVGHIVDGPLVQVEGLAVGGQARGVSGTGERGLERAAAHAGSLVVHGRMDLRGALELHAEFATRAWSRRRSPIGTLR